MQSDERLARDVESLLELTRELGRKNNLRDPVALAAAALDFSPPQIHALLWLGSDGPLPMSVLAQRVGVTDKTATGLVDRLEQSGHVERLRLVGDRRVIKVGLTAEGLSASRNLEQGVRVNARGVLSLLSEANRRALLRIMRALVKRVDEFSTKKSVRRAQR